jgi:hypothetical protein
MKRSLSIIILMLVMAGLGMKNLDAQNYKLVDKDRKMTFGRFSSIGLDSVYYFMQVDSFSLEGTDTVFYFNKNIQAPPLADPTCDFVFNDTVLLGSKVLVKSDTDITHVFFNRNNDSIFIHTQIKIGDSWKVYIWPDGSYVKGTVINHLYGELVPGIIDSLYRIKLSVYTLAGGLMPAVFPNDTKMDISQNLGIIEFFNFDIFPEPGDSIARVLRALTNPDYGPVDVDAQNAFTFEPGYEFHYREEVVPDNDSDADRRISAWKYFVMEADVDETGGSYTIERIQYDTLYFGATPTINITWDTLLVNHNFADYAFLDTLEFMVFENTNFGYSDFIKNDSTFAGVAHKYVYDNYEYDATTNCLSNPTTMPQQLYGDGLGLMQYLDSTDVNNYNDFEMTYFKLGLNEWGTPYDFSELDIAITNFQSQSLQMFPNPCVNEINLNLKHTKGIFEVAIFDISGKQLRSFYTNNSVIQVADLAPGMYVIKIMNGNEVYTGQFVKSSF